MHTKPMSESEGNFHGGWLPCDATCRGCGAAGNVKYRIWESSCGGYEDLKFRCAKCGKTWWIEGIDA